MDDLRPAPFKKHSPPAAGTDKGYKSLINKGVKGEYSAGNGLYLSVNGDKKGSWILRYQLEGKRRRIGLGSCSVLGLSIAREKAMEMKLLFR